MKVKVYNKKVENVGSISLPSSFFDMKWRPDIVKFVYQGMMANKRKSLAHVKDRSEVRGGGRKPWRQKGTGRARHGSIRSPIWRGGGVTHGPTKYKKSDVKIGKKIKEKAFYLALSQKIRDNEVFILDSLDVADGKTKSLVSFLEKISKKLKIANLAKKGSGIFLATKESHILLKRAARNIQNVTVKELRNLNVVDLLHTKYLIIEKEALEKINKVS